ncbi:hypothetical protein CC77DRAFT_64050 [Alternaria alternata]|uniref:Uncharacterized protein n=1 Tax=Alternaria alternata TaxID=5599 RepID=A0A177DL26_ALTAL|nr:hypothetical protein CC77DRAFT_64050 [Alternaria alternata]OAG20513.1 hypothetical protein CC77DRAFT_64050 [Alternaria alternata]
MKSSWQQHSKAWKELIAMWNVYPSSSDLCSPFFSTHRHDIEHFYSNRYACIHIDIISIANPAFFHPHHNTPRPTLSFTSTAPFQLWDSSPSQGRRLQHAFLEAHLPRHGSSSPRLLPLSHPPPPAPIAFILRSNRGCRQRIPWLEVVYRRRGRGGIPRSNLVLPKQDRERHHAIQNSRFVAND